MQFKKSKALTQLKRKVTMASFGSICAALLFSPIATNAVVNSANAEVTGPYAILDTFGRSRTFLIDTPSNQPRSESGFPVLFVYHGGGGTGAGIVDLVDFRRSPGAGDFLIVYPDALRRHWSDGRGKDNFASDLDAFDQALALLAANYPIDKNRVFATGFSNGAGFVLRLACARSQVIAGVAAVAGTMARSVERNCQPSSSPSVLFIHGTGDPIMPYLGGEVARVFGFGKGGQVLSVDESASLWARLNGCTQLQEASDASKGSTEFGAISSKMFSGCRSGSVVRMISLAGGGHTWPGREQYARRSVVGPTVQDFDASQFISEFFLAYAGKMK